MNSQEVVLCGASAYEQKYYFNEDFSALPKSVQDEIQMMCVMFTEDVGGVLMLVFDEKGNLQFRVEALEADAMFDDIGSGLKIKELQREKQELLTALETYYRIFFLGRSGKSHEGKSDHRQCDPCQSADPGAHGGGDRSSFPSAVQRAGRRSSLYRDDQCESHII